MQTLPYTEKVWYEIHRALRPRMHIESVEVCAGANKLSWTWVAELARSFWQIRFMKNCCLPFLSALSVVSSLCGRQVLLANAGFQNRLHFHSTDPCFEVSQDLTLTGLSLCSACWFVCCWAASMRNHWGSFARLSGPLLVLCGANVVPAKFISSGSAPWDSSHTISKKCR